MKKNPPSPLLTEPYPDDYTGFPFITLIRFNDENYLNIVDNVVNKQIIAYNLDRCAAEGINEMDVITVVDEWFTSGRNRQHPLSIEFSKRGMSGILQPIIRCYPIEFVTRVIGPLPEYTMSGIIKSRKRRKKASPK